ncbi:hypothetical protein SGPA1_20384 [Streptomyces misionensis JCM 4497]
MRKRRRGGRNHRVPATPATRFCWQV